MIRHLRRAGVAAAAGLLGLLLVVTPGRGGDDKELREGVDKLADLLDKKDADAAKKQAADLAQKYQLEEVMGLLEKRDRGGFGVGPKADVIRPDGIEAKLSDLATRKAMTDKEYAEQAEAIKRMALRAAAVAEVAQQMAPMKAKAAQWKGFADGMKKTALDLAAAKKPDEVRSAAGKVNGNCADCHAVFK